MAKKKFKHEVDGRAIELTIDAYAKVIEVPTKMTAHEFAQALSIEAAALGLTGDDHPLAACENLPDGRRAIEISPGWMMLDQQKAKLTKVAFRPVGKQG